MPEIYSLLKRKLASRDKISSWNSGTKPTTVKRVQLTPTPSFEELSNGSSLSPFFTVLSPEIRRLILAAAFGDRTIHLHYSYFNLIKPGKYVQPSHHRPGEHAKINLSRRKMRKSGYYWTSSVCHRANPFYLGPHGDIGPANDCCHWDSILPYCDAWAGEAPDKCLIGAMGFLLTCKQAYAEGMEVLYTTNTIHMGEAYLLGRLETLLLPQQLARIRSVELVWQLQRVELTEKTREQQSTVSATQFSEMVASLPRALPNLRNLTLVVNDQVRALGGFPRDCDERAWGERVLLNPVDRVVHQFKYLEHMEFAIPATIYLGLHPEINEAEWRNWRSAPNSVRTWRPLEETPGNGSTGTADTASRQGYCLAVGDADIPAPMTCF